MENKSFRLKAVMITLLGLIQGLIAFPQNTETYFHDATATHIPAAPELHSLGSTMVDVDKDGDLDIAIAVEYGENRLYLNDGTGKFTWKKEMFGKGEYDSEHVESADFNQDGLVDFVFVAEDDQQHQLFYGNNDGGYDDVSDKLLGKSEGNALAVADFNEDGLPDILIGNTGKLLENGETEPDNRNQLLINNLNSPGTFKDKSTGRLPELQNNTQGFDLADMDNDGDLDILIGNETPPNQLLINNGEGVFENNRECLDLPTPLETRDVHAEDFDNDGDRDIVFFNLTSNGQGWVKDPQIRLLINDGIGKFSDETAQRLPENKFSVYDGIPIDLNGDSALDPVVGSPSKGTCLLNREYREISRMCS